MDRGRRVELTAPPLTKKVRVERPLRASQGPMYQIVGAVRLPIASRTEMVHCIGPILWSPFRSQELML